MVMFTYLTRQFTVSAVSLWTFSARPGPYLSVSESYRGRQGWKARSSSPTGRPDRLLLSEADLIVRMGDGGVQAQGSVGQPYFLTLAPRPVEMGVSVSN